MDSSSNKDNTTLPKKKWVNVGKLWKHNHNPDKLRGFIEIEGVRFEVYAFINTPAQKKFGDEEDIRISMMVDEISDEDNPFTE